MRSRKDVAKTALERQTSKMLREEDFLTNRSSTQHGVLNEYVRVEHAQIVGRGSQSSSVKLYRSTKDLKLYAIKAFHQVRQGSKRPGKKDSLSLRATHSEREEVLREADIMRRLEHPHIVRIAELIDDCYGDTHTDTENDAMYLVMDYIKGCSLQSLLEESSPLPEDKLSLCMKDTISGLIYLHDCGIIHMDVKPANILFASDGSGCKLCDFGTSTFSASIDNAKRGTTLFRAPELGTGVGFPSDFTRGKAADVWSLGSTLYYLATLSRVHHSSHQVFHALSIDPVVLSPDMGLSAGLCNMLESLLEFDPEQRVELPYAMLHQWLSHSDEPVAESERSGCNLESERSGCNAIITPVSNFQLPDHPFSSTAASLFGSVALQCPEHCDDNDDDQISSGAEIAAWIDATQNKKK